MNEKYLIITTEYLPNRGGVINRLYNQEESPRKELGCENLCEETLKIMALQRKMLLNNSNQTKTRYHF